MAQGLGGQSPTNVTHHLKGIHFPATKQDLIRQAERNGAGQDVLDVLKGMPDDEFDSIAAVMQAASGHAHGR